MEEFQRLRFHINGCHHVFVQQIGRDTKVLPENVEGTGTADKPDQMITSCFGSCEWRCRCGVIGEKRQWRVARQGQGLERGLAVELAVARAAVVCLLEGQCPCLPLLFCSHGNAAQELLLIVMIEWFHHPVAPRLRLGDDPQLTAVQEATPDERPHPVDAWGCRRTPFHCPLGADEGPRAGPKLPPRPQRRRGHSD